MTKDTLLLIFERNNFYRRQYLLAMAAFGISIAVILVLLGVLAYVIRNPTEPLYFATDNVGRLINVIPVTQPNMSTDDAAQWAVKAVERTYSYDYVNYRSQLQRAEKYFTSYGWRRYMSALKSTNNLVALTQRKMIFEAKVVNSPKVTAQGLLSGAYAWKFEMPVLVTYWLPPYDDKSKFSNALNVSVIVQRQPILQSADGVGIVQMVATFASVPPTQNSSISDVPSG